MSSPTALARCPVMPHESSLTTVGALRHTSVFSSSARTRPSKTFPPISDPHWKRLPDDAPRNRDDPDRAVAAHLTPRRHRRSLITDRRLLAGSRSSCSLLPVRLSLLDRDGTGFTGHSITESHSGREVGHGDSPDL